MSTLFKNGDADLRAGPASTLASGVAVGAVSMSVAPGTGNRFPVVVAPDVALVTLENATNVEIIKITARALGADTMTIVKAQEGTTDRAWLTGDIVSMRITAAQAESAVNAQAVAAAALTAHAADTTDAHAASAITNTPAGNIAATTVQAALNELDSEKEAAGTAAAAVSAHTGDTSAAHAASAISYAGSANLSATDVEAALDELDSEKQSAAQVSSAISAAALPAATASVNGYMTSTYAAKLDGIQAGAIAGFPKDAGAQGVGAVMHLSKATGTLAVGDAVAGTQLSSPETTGAQAIVGTWRLILGAYGSSDSGYAWFQRIA